MTEGMVTPDTIPVILRVSVTDASRNQVRCCDFAQHDEGLAAHHDGGMVTQHDVGWSHSTPYPSSCGQRLSYKHINI